MNSLVFCTTCFLLLFLSSTLHSSKRQNTLYRGDGWRCLLFSLFLGRSSSVGLDLGGIESEMMGLYPIHFLEEIIATEFGFIRCEKGVVGT